MRTWQAAIVVSAAAMAGFSIGQQLQGARPPAPASFAAGTASNEVMPEPKRRGASDISVAPSAPLDAQAVALALAPLLAPALQEAAIDSASHTVRSSATAMHDERPPKPVLDAATSQQAFEQVAAVLTQQPNGKEWLPEQREVIRAAAPKLTLAQRKQLMEQFVAAQNRGDIDHRVAPPLL